MRRSFVMMLSSQSYRQTAGKNKWKLHVCPILDGPAQVNNFIKMIKRRDWWDRGVESSSSVWIRRLVSNNEIQSSEIYFRVLTLHLIAWNSNRSSIMKSKRSWNCEPESAKSQLKTTLLTAVFWTRSHFDKLGMKQIGQTKTGKRLSMKQGRIF